MSGGGRSTNSIEQLLGAQTGGPKQTVSKDEMNRIRVSANIVRQNYSAVEDFVDGKIGQDALFIVHKASEQEAISYLYGHLHNHLSSLYSFNEQIWEKVNESLPSQPFPKSRFVSGRSLYSEKLAFVRGLRHDVQHSEYGCLSLDCRHSAGDFKIYCIEFNERAFQQASVTSPRDHLRHTSKSDRRYPLPYIANFHTQHFSDFVTDSVDWLQGNP